MEDFLRPRELNVRSPRLYRRFLWRRRDCTAGKPASAFRPVSVPCPVILTSQHRLGSATSLLYPLATEKASLRVYYFEKKWLYACCSPCGSQRAEAFSLSCSATLHPRSRCARQRAVGRGERSNRFFRKTGSEPHLRWTNSNHPQIFSKKQQLPRRTLPRYVSH